MKDDNKLEETVRRGKFRRFGLETAEEYAYRIISEEVPELVEYHNMSGIPQLSFATITMSPKELRDFLIDVVSPLMGNVDNIEDDSARTDDSNRCAGRMDDE